MDGLLVSVSKEYKNFRGFQTVRGTGRDLGNVVEGYVAGGMRVHKNGSQSQWHSETVETKFLAF